MILSQDDLTEGDTKTLEVAIYDEAGKTAYNHSYGLDSCSSYYEVEMPRGIYTLSAVLRSTGTEMNLSEERIGLGPGRQAGKLYGESQFLDACGEMAETVIEPFKQFSNIDIRILSSPYDSLEISLNAASAAIDRKSLEGLQQHYSCKQTIIDGRARFSILRQGDGDLYISFNDAGSGKHITDIDLKQRLEEIGYDFSEESLSDIVLIVDFLNGTASVSIAGWLDATAYFVIF